MAWASPVTGMCRLVRLTLTPAAATRATTVTAMAMRTPTQRPTGWAAPTRVTQVAAADAVAVAMPATEAAEEEAKAVPVAATAKAVAASGTTPTVVAETAPAVIAETAARAAKAAAAALPARPDRQPGRQVTSSAAVRSRLGLTSPRMKSRI